MSHPHDPSNQPPAWAGPIDQPLPGADPDAEIRAAATRRGPNRATVALGVLAVLAVGILAGVLLRGAFGSSASAATTGAAGPAPGGYGRQGGFAGGGQGFQGFPGGGQTAGDATTGTIAKLTDGGFVLTTDAGDSVTVTVGSSTTVSITATGATSGALAAGQHVTVVGTKSGSTIAATAVREGQLGRFDGGADPNGSQPTA
jgi:hypothetical protein